MFWFCKKKPVDVFLYTTREDVFTHAKPLYAKKFLPNWWKELPKELRFDAPDQPLFPASTLKTCPGFTNLYASGLIFPMWSDLNVEIDNENYRYQFADQTSSLQQHGKQQFGACDLLENYKHLKLINPWVMHCKEKINFLTIAPTWNNFGHDDIVVLPGSYSMKQYIFAHANLLFKKKPEKTIYSLLFGRPLFHSVPVTERPINLHYKLVSEEELLSFKAKSVMFMMSFNRYRRAEKLCPHA